MYLFVNINVFYIKLTCMLLMNHVIFAAGRLGPNEQLALILSPTSYRDLANSINGMFVVNSVQEKKTKRKRVSR